MNIISWKFWLYLIVGALFAAVFSTMVLKGQTSALTDEEVEELKNAPEIGVKDVSPSDVLDISEQGSTPIETLYSGEVAQFTIEEKMSVKDKQTEYWRLQAQAASILLQASNLQMELTNEVMRLQVRCVESGGKFDPGTVNCLEIQAQEGK